MDGKPAIIISLCILSALSLAACSVQVKAPEKPITVDLNVKVAHEVNVKVSKDVDEMIKKNPNVF